MEILHSDHRNHTSTRNCRHVHRRTLVASLIAGPYLTVRVILASPVAASQTAKANARRDGDIRRIGDGLIDTAP